MNEKMKPDQTNGGVQFFDPSQYTKREIQIIELITWGNSNEVIAEKLGLKPGTIKQHKHRIKTRMEAPSSMRVAFDYLRYNHNQQLEQLANSMVGL